MYKTIEDLFGLSTSGPILAKQLALDTNMMYVLNEDNYKKVAELIAKEPKYTRCQDKYRGANFSGFSAKDWTQFVADINAENSTRAAGSTVVDLSTILRKKGEKCNWKFGVADVDRIIQELHERECRCERSLVSKVLKYHALWRYNDENTFVVNDAIIRAALPYYLKYYSIITETKWPTADNMDYLSLSDLMNRLQAAVPLSKHKIDQIIWYCYKSDSLRLATIKAMYVSTTG